MPYDKPMEVRMDFDDMVEKMTKDGHAVALLSGELSVEDRIQVLDRFRDGLEKILITTNVMSRGIDIEQG